MKESMKKLITGFLLGLLACGVVFWLVLAAVVVDRRFGLPFVDQLVDRADGGRIEKTVVNRLVEEESGVAGIVEKVGPSVVTVTITKQQAQSRFWFFGDGGEEELVEEDIGSGFVVSAEGLIVTNKHVVDDREAIYRVITAEGETIEITKIYRDPVNDLAILQAESKNLVSLELGDSDQLKVGHFVIAIGTALGEFRNTVTTGVISGLGRGVTAGSSFAGYVEQVDDVIQTDAAINPGNSGGPLLDGTGRAIGVNWAVSASGENIGFAIPINIVKASLASFAQTGSFDRPFLGVRFQMIDEEVALENKLPQGAYIVEIVADSPAHRAGLQRGDIITHFDDQQLKQEVDLVELINHQKVGDQVAVRIWREGTERELAVRLDEFEEN
ncbi:trypsin-like peptidase domain-containing protein [Patescibacteria group bacterium]|nr:trypsin-like peptidase domain-containing protein [Patescibacteria group bacterium]